MKPGIDINRNHIGRFFFFIIMLLPACSHLKTNKGNSKSGKSDAFLACLENFSPANDSQGWASWYGKKHHGLPTASGEKFDMHALTAAHPSLPFGSQVRIQSLCSDESVIVRVNDRGPHTGKRLIDVSYSAARALDMISMGLIPVEIPLLPP